MNKEFNLRGKAWLGKAKIFFKEIRTRISCFIILILFVTNVASEAGALGAWFSGQSIKVNLDTPRPRQRPIDLAAGKILYNLRCAVCHGERGDSMGPEAVRLVIKPHDFTEGIFKFRSTPAGSPPTDEDLYRTIFSGLHGTAMLPWGIALTPNQIWLLVYYIKTFCDYCEYGDAVPVEIPDPPSDSWEYVARGRLVYEKAGCWECHGREGYGDGPKADKLKDDYLRPIRPRNFRKEIPKRGLGVGEIYLTVATGLDGTPMASYGNYLSEDDILAVAYYVRSLLPAYRPVSRETLSSDEIAATRIDHHMAAPYFRNDGEY